MKIWKTIACVLVLTVTMGNIPTAEALDLDKAVAAAGSQAILGGTTAHMATHVGIPTILIALKTMGVLVAAPVAVAVAAGLGCWGIMKWVAGPSFE
jgi:hypothetical protein